MNTQVYKATVSTPFGKFIFAVLSTEQDARADILTIAQHDTKSPFGMIRVGKVQKSNRRILASMSPIKSATAREEICYNGYWAFVKKA